MARAHARGLQEHGVEADLLTLAEVGDARGRYDVAIGTWWETVPALWRLDATHRAVLLQSFEQRFYDSDAPFERLSAECTLSMPLHFIAVADWMRALLEELRPGARCWVARPGIDKERFGAAREVRREGPLRVLIEGAPSLPFKGVARRGGGRARDARAGPVDARGPRSRRYRRARRGPRGHGAGAGRDGRAVPRARRAVEALARGGPRARAGRGLPLRASVRRVALHGALRVRASRRERAGGGLRRRARHRRGARPARRGPRPARAAVRGRGGDRGRLARHRRTPRGASTKRCRSWRRATCRARTSRSSSARSRSAPSWAARASGTPPPPRRRWRWPRSSCTS